VSAKWRHLLVPAIVLLVTVLLVACDGDSSSPSPEPDASPTPSDSTPSQPTPNAEGTSTPAPAGSPQASGPVVPAFPDSVEAAQDPALVARVSSGAVIESEFETIYRVQLQTTAGLNDVQGFYLDQLEDPPYSWIRLDWFGSGELRRGVYTKNDGQYAAWVLILQASGVARPTFIVLELGERIDAVAQ
jgi:hypothetical protein